MPRLGRPGRQLKSFLWRESIEEQVDAELAFHLEMLVRELVEKGADPAAARAEAMRRFGDVDAVTATCRRIGTQTEREMRRTEYFAEFTQDVGYALRGLARSKAFAAVAVLTLSLGLGASTAIFSAVQSVVLRPFGYAHPERVAILYERWNDRDGNVSAGNFVDWAAGSRSFAAMAAEQFSGFTLASAAGGSGDGPERVFGGRVTHDFFAVYGARPALGRFFLPEEDTPGREQVVVLSHALWTNRFNGDRAILGKSIRLNASEYTVVGVAPKDFNPGLNDEALFVPAAFDAERRAQHDEHYLNATGLLRPGVSMAQAQLEMDAVMRRVAAAYPKEDAGRGIRVARLDVETVGDFRQRLLTILGAVMLVLLIACGNVANLLLARGASRQKELAIRSAIGAGRGRIVRQLLTESLVLGLASAVVGTALAYGLIKVLVANAPPGIPRLEQTRVDGVVLAFALGAGVLSSLLFGVVPALRAARKDLQGTLREGGRGMGSARDAVRTALVVGEVALALTLLTGAGLLIRSAIYLQQVRPGFDPSGVLTARVALPQAAYADSTKVVRAFTDMVEHLRTTPGVLAAAASSQAPMGPGGNSNGLVPEGRPMSIENSVDARLRIITPGFLSAMRIPLQRGRAFTASDTRSSELVAIVSAGLAKQMWPNEDPIGKRFACCEGSETDPKWKTVVGVAGDVRGRGPAEDVVKEFYLPIDQAPPVAWNWLQRAMTLVARADPARGAADAAALTPAMRAAVRAVDPALPLYGVQTMQELSRATTAAARFNTMLLGTLGAIGLVLAAVGIYGVIAYFVSLRTHEIGVRMALGATARDVLALMTWQGLRPVLGGVVLGIGAALAATRVLRTSLYGVSATDPLTFAGVVAVLTVVGLLATLIPARRATRVDPTTAMRSA